ncbi:hypothetical protein NEMIN01_1562 [Nematocida minor]|uniref:uncharacterized protein n=1 Tax=Nematocida minor TaxID=1912983 RepID=UPI0022203D53|nr:uncharacterized protein NEMIN01_1562 [Nematocida minor]KAI5191536.1 hypothetical protein NEMIN01_1562 [Nematocida minor]
MKVHMKIVLIVSILLAVIRTGSTLPLEESAIAGPSDKKMDSVENTSLSLAHGTQRRMNASEKDKEMHELKIKLIEKVQQIQEKLDLKSIYVNLLKQFMEDGNFFLWDEIGNRF